MYIGNRIKTLREAKKISSRQLALKVGMSVGYLSDIERNEKKPTIDMLEKICNALEIDLKDFFDEEKSIIISKPFKQFFQDNHDLTSEQLELITKLIKTLK